MALKNWDPADPDAPDPEQWLEQWHQWRDQRQLPAETGEQAALDALAGAQAVVAQLSAWVETVAAAEAAAEAAGSTLATQRAQTAAVEKVLAGLAGALTDRQQARDMATARLLAGPDTGTPIVLLPVRLQTSWLDGQLRVRIYPDDAWVDTHDGRLTAAEKAAGAAYRATSDIASRQSGRAGRQAKEQQEQQAWQDLVAAVGPGRAAWVAGQPLATGDRDPWERTVTAPLLPDRFAVTAYAAGEPVDLAAPGEPARFVTWGAPVPRPLRLPFPPEPGDHSWLTDYDAALAAGMAVTLPVPGGAPPIDRLVAVGVRTTTGRLDDLVTAHAFTDGAEVLADGVPTNNSGALRAAHSPALDADVAYALLARPATLHDSSAGRQLATALGLEADTLGRIAGAEADRGGPIEAMARVVGTGVGSALSDLLADRFPVLWERYAPLGVTPALRLGRQPYAVLPATAAARWRAGSTGGPDADVDALLEGWLHTWADGFRAPVDVDPLAPPSAPALARHVTRDDDEELTALLLESATSVGWSGDGGTYDGLDGLVGHDGAATDTATWLRALAQAAGTDLAFVATSLPDVLLARVALAARYRAGYTDTDAAVRTALGTLADLAGTDSGRDDLARLLAAHLDALGHRDDVVLTAAVAHRLAAQRAALASGSPSSVPVGAYGVLTDVAPRTDPRSRGHVHAPSLPQAATAAVLRAGYLSERRAAGHGPDAERHLALAVDLSSARVRSARWLLAAVRDGQPLAALLGYGFERDLADAGLQRYLAAFRKLTRFNAGRHLDELEQQRTTTQAALAAATQRLAELDATAADVETGPVAAAQAGLELALAEQLATTTGAGRPYLDLLATQAQVEASLPGLLDQANAAQQAAVPLVRVTLRPIATPVGADTARIVDPEYDTGGSRTGPTTAAVAARAQYLAAVNRLAQLGAALLREPALSAKTAVDAAAGRVRDAHTAVDIAHDRLTAATGAASAYRAGPLADAQYAADQATEAVAGELARLLAEATTGTALTATVDGLALRTRYAAATASDPPVWSLATVPFRTEANQPLDPEITLPPTRDPDYLALRAVLDQLDDRVDAVADLVTAEGVHHLVNGNPVRAGAAVDLAAGGTVPDDLDVVRTPAPGAELVHRVLALQAPGARASWGPATRGRIAATDPDTNAWLTRMLPDPSTVHVVVRRVGDDGDLADELSLTADALGLDAIDWVRLATSPDELRARVARVARAHWSPTAGSATGRVDLADPAPPLAAGLPLSALTTAAAAAGRVVSRSRALAAADLAPPGAQFTSTEPTLVQAVLARVTAAEDALGALYHQLSDSSVATGPLGGQRDALLDALLAAAALGVAEALPGLADGPVDDDTLRAQAGASAGRLAARTTGPDLSVAPDDPTALGQARQRAAEVVGTRLPLMIPVAVPDDDAVHRDLGAARSRITGVQPPLVRHWLHDHARVRPVVEAALHAFDMAESLGGTGRLDLRVTQLPVVDHDSWVEVTTVPRAGMAHVVIVRGYADVPATVTGLCVDTWTQTVPADSLTTGLAVHYDEPDAYAGQALLVAVAPDVDPARVPATWDLDTLVETVLGTLDLAATRAALPVRGPVAEIRVLDEP